MKKILMALIYAGSLLYVPGVFAADSTVTGVADTSGGPSVKDSSDKTSSGNKQGQIMSLLMGGMLAAQSVTHFTACKACSASKPCPWECVKGAVMAGMAAMSMMQAKEHGSVAGSSGLTSGLTDGGKNPYDTGSYDPTIDNKNPDIAAANSAFKKIQSSGALNATTGKIKTPDGKEYNVSDFASEKSMAAAGIPSGAIKGAMSHADALSKKAEEKADKIVAKAGSSEDSFGGGGGGSTTIVAVDDEAGGAGAGRGQGLGLKRDPAQLAGMQKNYNGEPIGVAADSIFLMMNRRYQVKQSQDSFFGDMDLRLQK